MPSLTVGLLHPASEKAARACRPKPPPLLVSSLVSSRLT